MYFYGTACKPCGRRLRLSSEGGRTMLLGAHECSVFASGVSPWSSRHHRAYQTQHPFPLTARFPRSSSATLWPPLNYSFAVRIPIQMVIYMMGGKGAQAFRDVQAGAARNGFDGCARCGHRQGRVCASQIIYFEVRGAVSPARSPGPSVDPHLHLLICRNCYAYMTALVLRWPKLCRPTC